MIGALFALGKSKDSSGLYFIGRCEDRILKDYIEEVGRIYGKQVDIGVRPDDGLRYKKEWFNNSRLVNEIGYHFKYSFTEGVLASRNMEE